MQATRILASLILSLLVLQACSPKISKEPEIRFDPQLLSQAESLRASGDQAAAAALLEQAARAAPAPQRQELQWQAVEAWIAAGRFPEARAGLARIASTPEVGEADERRRLLAATIALGEHHLDEALGLLAVPPSPTTAPALRRRYHELRAEIWRGHERWVDSAEECIRIDPLLTSEPERLSNQLSILQDLSHVSPDILEILQPGTPPLLRGWLELARLLRDPDLMPNEAASLVAVWREQFPQHPALPEIEIAYLARLPERAFHPRQIAVLLPANPRLLGATEAIRDGLLAAYFEQPANKRPRLRFHDTQEPAAVRGIYEQALTEGADVVFGPLEKDEVEMLARSGGLKIPVLAFNQLPAGASAPRNFYQFALTPEDEAIQVAQQARNQGYQRALIFYPSGEWGERLAGRFRETWEIQGGLVPAQQSYDPQAKDVSRSLRALLKLPEKAPPSAANQAAPLADEPQIRQDADCLFLVARSGKARVIRPLLQALHGDGLPLFTTSHAYDLEQSPEANRDLNGLQFTEIPWLFGEDTQVRPSLKQVKSALPGFSPAYTRLYAMGLDGYQLWAQIPRLQRQPQESHQGAGGELRLDPDTNQIRRRLSWAQISGGLAYKEGRLEQISLVPRHEAPPSPIPPTVPPSGSPAPVPETPSPNP